jgi:hypothetical protein
MSVIKVATIYCDARWCHRRWSSDISGVTPTRHDAGKAGWVSVAPLPGDCKTLDYCPAHAGEAPYREAN